MNESLIKETENHDTYMNIRGAKKLEVLKTFVTSILFLLGLVYLYPLFLCLISSFKTKSELAESAISLPSKLILQNYVEAFIKAQFIRHFVNTIVITAIFLVLIIIVGSMAAYSIGRWKSKWAKWSSFYIMCGLIAPFQLALIPVYKIMRDLHLTGSLWGLSILFTAHSLPLSIFMWSGFIKTIPIQMEESAKIDGCSMFRMFWQIIFPLLKPVTVTVIILSGIGVWNDFLYAMLFLPDSRMQTLPLSIYTFVGQYGNDWPQIFAVIVLIEAPIIILYLFAQKHIIKGMTSGAVKG